MAKAEYVFNEREHSFCCNSEDDPAARYIFIVTRLKSGTTGLERIDIEAGLRPENKRVGHIEAKFTTLLDDLRQLTEYGVVIPRTSFGELHKAIESNYYALPITIVDFDDDLSGVRLSGVLSMIKASIVDAQIKAREINGIPFYCVPSVELKDWIASSEFYAFDPTELKRTLVKNGYISANQGRYDRNVEIDGKQVKCVSFFEAKIREMGKLPSPPTASTTPTNSTTAPILT